MFDELRAKMAVAKNLHAMMKNEDAKVGSGQFGKIVGLFIMAILIGSVFISGIQTLENASTDGLTTTEIALISVLGLILIVGAFWLILQYVGLV